MATEQRWVYRSSLGNWGLVIKPTTREGIYDAGGRMINTITKDKIKVNFVDGMLVVDEAMGNRFGYEPSDLAKLIEKQTGFRKSFFLVSSPSKVLTKGEVEEMERKLKEGRKSVGARMIKGVRGLNN